ncbi:MAG: restriction endonuclease [Clostridia bacterium]|nr:restriction endonuclease [Clostridia bacterium]
MGFLKSFFAAMAANEISEKKRQEAENKKAILNSCRNVDKILSAERLFLDYLKQLNCRDVEFSDLITDEQIENGTTTDYDVLHAQQIIDGYKQQLKEFMRIGGDPQYVKNFDRLDLYIEIVKRLKEYGWLDNQQKYIEYAEDTDALDLDWELSQISHQINNAVAYEDINSLSGVEFENVCQALVEKMGFTTQTTKASGDGGIDLIAYNHQPLLSGKYIIQCKRYTGSVGEPIIRDLYGVIMSERANKGILMTTGHFTKSAIGFAEGKPIELIDGATLKNLMSQYGLHTNNSDNQTFVDVVGNQDIIKTAQEMWELWDETGYEDDYYTLIELKKTADNATDEIKVAEYINWLLEKVDFDTFDICNHSEKIVFWNEVNTYIRKFLNIRSVPKSKLLSYLYQMKFVQNSILLERFTEAKTMFIEMMKDAGIQFNLYETMRETHSTDEIFEHTGVFSFLFATWCNMYQIASISNDDALQEYLNDDHLFYGIPVMQNTRIEDNLELIRSGKSGLNALYFENQQKLIQEIDKWYACEPIQTKIFFRIENIDIIKSFFDYAYYDGETEDDLIEYCTYVIEDGKMVIDYYTTIDLKNALRGYIPFSQKDLN